MAGGPGAGGQGDYSDHLSQSWGAMLFCPLFLLRVLSAFSVCARVLLSVLPICLSFLLTVFAHVLPRGFGAQEWQEEHGGALRCHLGAATGAS